MMIEDSVLVAPIREPRYVAGFTAIGIVVLAALAYAVRLSLDPSAGDPLLTATLLVANVIGWLLGSMLRRRDPRSVSGLLLVLLGDAIFPLNLFAPLILYVPLLRGNAAASATAVVAIGILYHLWNYRRRSRVRFALPFYPYFFALAGAAGLTLTQYTFGLSPWLPAWLVLLYAVAFQEMSFRRRPEPDVHFGIAASTLFTSAIGVAVFAYRDRHPAALAAIVAATVLAIVTALRERDRESIGRAHGLAAWLGVTATFTALLYAAHSELWVYSVATGAWAIVLVILSMLPRRDWSEPFHESAWWAAMLLSLALAAALWQVWTPLIVRILPGQALVGATSGAVTIALLEAGMALAVVSAWRRRHPPIAGSLRGFVTNSLLLRLASYAAPMLLVLAFAGAWRAVGAPPPGNVYALVVAGVLLLIAGPMLERMYPGEALDFAGVLAMIFAAFNALASTMLSAAVLFAAALIFLVRHRRTGSRWAFVSFLALTVSGLTLQKIGTAPATTVFLLAAVAMAWGSTRATAIAARIGFWLAHAAGLIFWLSLARTLGLGSLHDAAVLATWSLVPLVAYRAARGLASRTSLHVCVVLIVASFAMVAWWPAAPVATVVALVALAAVLLELGRVDLLAYAFLVAAAFVASEASEGDPAWLVAVFAVAALILLRRSLAHRSALGHLLFIACAVAAAYLAMPLAGGMQTSPFVALVAILLLIELLALRMRASPFHADVTSVMALVIAVSVLVAEVVSTRFSVGVLAVLLLSLLLIRPWIKPSETHRVQPVAHATFAAVAMVTVSIVIVAATRLFAFTPAQQLLSLSICGVAVLAWLLSRGAAATWSTAMALHAIALGVYVAAFILGGWDPLVLLACVIVAAVYAVWRAAWRMPLLEHLAGFGIVLAVCLWGVEREIVWPELYLFAAAGYLCVMLARNTAYRFTNAVAIVAIATAVAYPCFALLQTRQQEHLAFLGLGAVVIIHVLLTTRRHVAMVLTACGLLGLGMAFGAATLPGDVRLNLLMAGVGFVVIADLGVIGIRSGRRAVVEKIVGEIQ